MENVLVLSTKISKKVGVPSVEGRKKSMSRIITLYSQCTGGTICNAVIATYSWGLGVL